MVRPQAVFTPCGSWVWSRSWRQELWEHPVFGTWGPFLELPQPGGRERSVPLGAVQKHRVVRLSALAPGRLFLSWPRFLRSRPPLRLASASEPMGRGAGDLPRAWTHTWADGPLHCSPSTSAVVTLRSLGDEGTDDSPEQWCREGRMDVWWGQLGAHIHAGCAVAAVSGVTLAAPLRWPL